jgi:hypothetical protein
VSDATETPAPATATLTISRNAPDDVQDRWVRVVIDGSPEEILRYGHVLRSNIAPGRHEIKAHNTLSSDVLTFDAAPGQAVHVRCYNRVAKGGVLMMLTTGFAFISVRLELAPDPAP